MRLRSIPPITSTGRSRSPRLEINIGIGRFGEKKHAGISSSAFNLRGTRVKKAKKKSIINISLVEENGFLKMYIEEEK